MIGSLRFHVVFSLDTSTGTQCRCCQPQTIFSGRVTTPQYGLPIPSERFHTESRRTNRCSPKFILPTLMTVLEDIAYSECKE